MDEVVAGYSAKDLTINSNSPGLEFFSPHRDRAARLVSKLVLVLSNFIFLLCLIFAAVSNSQLWSKAVIASFICSSIATFCWWLVKKGRVILAARINIITLALVLSILTWLTPFFALYLFFLSLIILVHLINGLRETLAISGLLFVNSLLYLSLNQNHMYAPDDQLVVVDFATFLVWWAIIGEIVWMVSFLYHTVQRDNLTLNLQTIELKAFQQQLQESKERYRALSQASFEGIVLHEQGKVLEANQTLAEMLGYSLTDLTGKNLSELVRPLQDTSITKSEWLLQDNCPLEGWGVRKDGTLFSVECQSRDFTFRRGTVKVCAIRDITLRRQTEDALKFSQQELLHAQKMESIGRLAGGIAHDFNNLLSVILGESSLLLNDIDQNHPHYAQILEIQSATERAGNLTRQLLAFSRKQKLEPRIVNLNKIVTGMDNLVHRLIGSHIKLNLKLSPDIAPVKVDPGQFEQIIMNLAINARDAMPHRGEFTISTSNYVLQEDWVFHSPNFSIKKGEYVLLEVSDNGIGMDQETQARIFEPFFTTKEVGKGTGLGLAIIFGVVKQSGGYILVQSMPGRGTTFRIYLPIFQVSE